MDGDPLAGPHQDLQGVGEEILLLGVLPAQPGKRPHQGFHLKI